MPQAAAIEANQREMPCLAVRRARAPRSVRVAPTQALASLSDHIASTPRKSTRWIEPGAPTAHLPTTSSTAKVRSLSPAVV